METISSLVVVLDSSDTSNWDLETVVGTEEVEPVNFPVEPNRLISGGSG